MKILPEELVEEPVMMDTKPVDAISELAVETRMSPVSSPVLSPEVMTMDPPLPIAEEPASSTMDPPSP